MSLSWFVSVDDHLIEPARLWQDRLPERWREAGPRIVREGTSEFWVYEDRQIVTTGLNAVAGKKREEFSPEPITYQDMRPGCYDPAARVADMNQGFVLASMLFPSLPRPGVPRGQGPGARAAVRPGLERLHPGGARAGLPGPVHPDDAHPAVGPCGRRGRDRADRGPWRQVDRVLREPDQAGAALDPHRLLAPGVPGVRGGRPGYLHARRILLQPDPHLGRHADAGVHGLLGGGQSGRHPAGLAVQRQLH